MICWRVFHWVNHIICINNWFSYFRSIYMNWLIYFLSLFSRRCVYCARTASYPHWELGSNGWIHLVPHTLAARPVLAKFGFFLFFLVTGHLIIIVLTFCASFFGKRLNFKKINISNFTKNIWYLK
jgi:hypothetical protein